MVEFSAIPQLDAAEVLRQHGLKPEKGLGQNFLQDAGALQSIASAAEVSPDDTVLEIGPGVGSLTRYLAAAARRVIAVELDERLLALLRETLAGVPNVELVHGDILKLDPGGLAGGGEYIVAANIPYNITSAVIRHLVDPKRRDGSQPSTRSPASPRRIVLTVQDEVARRICAGPGDLSLLALSVQIYGAPRIAATIPARAFYPVPKVDSACLRVDIYPRPRIDPELTELFFRTAKAGFSQRRKTLRNSLSAGLHLSSAQAESLLEATGISPQRRAETVSIEEWAKLAAALRA
jgi:16S rRNA (adenine1518-N6/adenine1519-N6)-dimethyltransferase